MEKQNDEKKVKLTNKLRKDKLGQKYVFEHWNSDKVDKISGKRIII